MNRQETPNSGLAGVLRQDAIFLVLLLLGALAIRLDFLLAADFRIDSDEAIVGLMAKHILEGLPVPVFFYGQHYMGSFEALVAAAYFQVFGISTPVLKAVPLTFSLLFVVLVYLLAWELGGRAAARIAAVLAAFPPSALVIWSAMARGGFIEIVALGALALLISSNEIVGAKFSPRRLFALGLVLGFGWWVNNQIIYFMLPIGLLLSLKALASWRANGSRNTLLGFLSGTTGFFVGGLPYWIYNLKNDFVSLGMFQRASGKQALLHLTGVFQTAFPILLGAKRFWNEKDIFTSATGAMWVLYGVLFLVVIWHKRRSLFSLLVLHVDRDSLTALLLAFLASVVCVFSLSSFGYLVEAPRYMLPAYAAVFPLVALAVVLLWKRSRLLGVMAFAALLSLNLMSCYLDERAVPGEPFVFEAERASKDHSQLIAWLREQSISWVRTDYWIGYRLAFETHEQVRFLLFGEPRQARIPSYEREGRLWGKERMPLVLTPSHARLIAHGFKVRGYRFNSIDLSGYRVIYSVEPEQSGLVKLGSDQISATASVHNEYAPLAIDQDPGTRFRSEAPQVPGMQLIVRLKKPTKLRGLRYELGRWVQDFPRSLAIHFKLTNGEIVEILSPADYDAVQYFFEGDTAIDFYFPPYEVEHLALTNLGTHPILDWSVAEVELFR